MSKKIILNNKTVSCGSPAYIIAEIGLNHNNDIELAKKMISSAKESGADAVKFQYYITENLMVADSPAFGIFKELEISPDFMKDVKDYSDSIGIECFATPFCKKTADYLAEIDVPFYKISSMDLNYYDLLHHIGMKRKPVILSTGMSSFGEIEKAVNTLLKSGNKEIVLLHCISKYPPESADMNLNMINKLNVLFPELVVGFSDHSMDNTMCIAARAMGALVFERHFTLDRELPGPDQKISLDPAMFKDLRTKLTQVEEAMTAGEDRADMPIARGARRSLFAANEIKAGQIIKEEDIKVVRPGTGIAPEYLSLFIGKKACKDIKKDEQFSINSSH